MLKKNQSINLELERFQLVTTRNQRQLQGKQFQLTFNFLARSADNWDEDISARLGQGHRVLL